MNAWIAWKAWRQLKGFDMGKYNSRKLLAVAITGALAAVNEQFKVVTPDVMYNFMQLVTVYIGGQTIVDTAEKWKGNGHTPTPGGPNA